MHKLLGLGAGLLLLAATPSSTNYQLKSYDVGGTSGSSSSTNYRLNGQSGSQSGVVQSSTTYGTASGVKNTSNSSVPPAPTFTNPANYYDRLRLTINTGGNPSDTKYLIAISSDNFTTTLYVQADNTVGSSQAIGNYQTYSAWGGASGFLILGLSPSTTYQVKVKSLQGASTGSAFGPTASAATVATSLTMNLATTATSTPPYPINFTGLTAGAFTAGSADAVVGLTSNANNGGTIYLRSLNAGLLSTLASTTIASATADLSSAGSGYGGQITAVSQASGSPLSAQSPYNGSANNVGALSTTLQALASTTGPITSGSATLRLFAKTSTTTPSANDYNDVLTFVIAMNY